MFSTIQGYGVVARKKASGGGNTIISHPTLSNGMTHYYKFDNDLVDAVGSADGTNNGATYTASGKINGGYGFVTNDYVALPNTVINPPEGAIAMWVKFNSTSGLQMCVGSDQNERFYFGQSGGDLYCRLDGSSDFASGTINIDTWYHLGVTWRTDGTAEAYLNGVSAGTTTGVTFTSAVQSKINLGSYFEGFSSFVNGTMDEIPIWDRDVTSSEFSDLFAGGAGMPYN